MLLVLALLPYSVSSGKIQPLEQWYQYYNQALFNHELPDNIQIDHQLRDPGLMAVTECELTSKVCRINMNPDYEMSDKVARLNLLHESCHVKLFVEQEYEFNDHGQKWQGCMHMIANKNGFEDLW